MTDNLKNIEWTECELSHGYHENGAAFMFQGFLHLLADFITVEPSSWNPEGAPELKAMGADGYLATSLGTAVIVDLGDPESIEYGERVLVAHITV